MFAFNLRFLAFFLCASNLLSPSTELAILNNKPGAVDPCSYQPRTRGNLQRGVVEGILGEEDIIQIRYEQIRQQLLQNLCHPQAESRALEPIKNAVELPEKSTGDIEKVEVEETVAEESVVIFPNNRASITTSSAEHRPYLVANARTRSTPRTRRQTTTTDCNNDGKCCREDLYITFRELEWGKFISYPYSYNAHYCRGECVFDPNSSPNLYTSLLSQYTRINSTAAAMLEFQPCCKPATFLPLNIAYDTNGTSYINEIPDMIVDSCKCV